MVEGGRERERGSVGYLVWYDGDDYGGRWPGG